MVLQSCKPSVAFPFCITAILNYMKVTVLHSFYTLVQEKLSSNKEPSDKIRCWGSW